MKAGRELDAMVHEMVMGHDRPRVWSLHPCHSWDELDEGEIDVTWRHTITSRMALHDAMIPFEIERPDADGAMPGYDAFPHYSTDIAAAWEVVEKMQADGFAAYVNYADDSVGAEFDRLSDVDRPYVYGESEADTAPLAICLAALEAVGAEVPS